MHLSLPSTFTSNAACVYKVFICHLAAVYTEIPGHSMHAENKLFVICQSDKESNGVIAQGALALAVHMTAAFQQSIGRHSVSRPGIPM